MRTSSANYIRGFRLALVLIETVDERSDSSRHTDVEYKEVCPTGFTDRR